MLDHVAARAPDLPVPRVILNDKGERHFTIWTAPASARQVRMMSYLEGQPLSEVPSTHRSVRKSANWLARLRLALADFSHPSDSRVVAWDVKNLLTLRDLLAEITDAAQRRKVEAALERFAAIETRLNSAACRCCIMIAHPLQHCRRCVAAGFRQRHHRFRRYGPHRDRYRCVDGDAQPAPRRDEGRCLCRWPRSPQGLSLDSRSDRGRTQPHSASDLLASGDAPAAVHGHGQPGAVRRRLCPAQQ